MCKGRSRKPITRGALPSPTVVGLGPSLFHCVHSCLLLKAAWWFFAHIVMACALSVEWPTILFSSNSCGWLRNKPTKAAICRLEVLDVKLSPFERRQSNSFWKTQTLIRRGEARAQVVSKKTLSYSHSVLLHQAVQTSSGTLEYCLKRQQVLCHSVHPCNKL
jgi:hypothetical protein